MSIGGLEAAERQLDMLKGLDATIEDCAARSQNALHDELAEATATRVPVRSCAWILPQLSGSRAPPDCSCARGAEIRARLCLRNLRAGVAYAACMCQACSNTGPGLRAALFRVQNRILGKSCAAHPQDSWNVLVRGELLPEPADGDATAKFSSFVEKVCIHGVPDEPKLQVRRALRIHNLGLIVYGCRCATS